MIVIVDRRQFKESRKAKFKLIILIFFVSSFLIQGCLPKYIPLESKFEVTKTYKVGEQIETSVGSSMLIISELPYKLTYRAKHSFKTPKGFEITPHQVWIANQIKVRTDKQKQIICLVTENLNPPPYFLHIEIYEDGEIAENWNLTDTYLFVKSEKIIDNTSKKGGFKAELIYNGISKNTIKISYREFIENFTRPAFYQELTYDLDQSDLIQFKSLKIRILKADNSSITFKIVDDSGLPWIPKR